MPNITIYLSPEKMKAEQKMANLTQQYIDLCTTVLQAKLDKVHIIYVSSYLGYGHPAYIEIKYRLENHRTEEIMAVFLQKMDQAMQQVMGITPRIRCFGYSAAQIAAIN